MSSTDSRASAGMRFLLLKALVTGPWRDHPGRNLLALFAIAIGVALGVAVHLVNASAANEFERAARQLAGEADIIVRGPRTGFDESWYPRIARLQEVTVANPAIELDAPLVDMKKSIKIVGTDPFRAVRLQPALLGAERALQSGLLDPDAVVISAPAAREFGLREGDAMRIYVGTAIVTLRVAGVLPEGAYRQPLALMDIATAQWRLARLGRLNRIDLRLRAGIDVTAFRRDLQQMLPPGVLALTPDIEAGRSANLTRAYRLNLDMLALIALFTGAFLVLSTQMLPLLRRRSQLALLRVLGMSRKALAWRLMTESTVLGALGAGLGVVFGYFLARYAVSVVGGDLGAGFFRGVSATLHPNPVALAAFFALGILFALAGAALPVWEASRRAPAQALRAGDEEAGLARWRAGRIGLALLLCGAFLAQAPAIDGLPIAGYGAIICIVIGAVLVMPPLTAFLLRRMPFVPSVPGALAIAQLQATPRQAAISIAAIVTSVSLMVSMLVMVNSFRTSLESWLGRMLPADVYLRVVRGGETGFLTPAEQARIATTPELARVEFIRFQNLLLDHDRPPAVVMARPLPPERAVAFLPLTEPAVLPSADAPPPVWISEAIADLYAMKVGQTVHLPIGTGNQAFTVAGIWRDYARQTGTIAIDRTLYIRLTGDALANDAALWLRPAVSADTAQRAVRARLDDSTGIEMATTSEVRAASLALFDRTFAVTYALEIAAIAIGLIGVSVSFSAQALARRREFGVLRHIGMTRRQIAAMLGIEGALLSALGVAFGMATGWVISVILVHVINRQSFHWSMETSLPLSSLTALSGVIVAASAVTAIVSARAAMREEVVRAVREDW
jgi:putative ABC transport system permease protein